MREFCQRDLIRVAFDDRDGSILALSDVNDFRRRKVNGVLGKNFVAGKRFDCVDGRVDTELGWRRRLCECRRRYEGEYGKRQKRRLPGGVSTGCDRRRTGMLLIVQGVFRLADDKGSLRYVTS